VWQVELTECFLEWFNKQDKEMRLDILAALTLLKQEGPYLGRPYADTLHGARISNMKELRVQSNGRPVRALFVFDPARRAIVLCAANKAGRNEKAFYRTMIKKAEREYDKHLERSGR